MANGEKILIVEDERIIALNTRIGLEDMGYTVVGVAVNGEEAVRMFKEHTPDLVLMDIMLKSAMDGIAAAEEMQRHAVVPMLFISGNIDDQILQRIKQIKNSLHLSKPCDEHALDQGIQLILGNTNSSST